MQEQLSKILHDIQTTSVTDNSNLVTKGCIFFAIKGTKTDGHKYIISALEKGAKTIIIDKGQEQETQKITKNYIAVTDSREALAFVAAKKYSLPRSIVAITGTDGKSSTAFFYKEILTALKINAAAIGTMGVLSNKKEDYFKKFDILTTPGTLQLYKILEELREADVNCVSLEASSHGICQKRLDFIPLKAAAFTSFGRDHLDYHKDFHEYLEAKLRLFNTLLPSTGIAVINNDSAVAPQVLKACGDREKLTYGTNGTFIKIEDVTYHNTKMSAKFIIAGKDYSIYSNLFGDFQIYNLACAIALLHATGYSYKDCIEVIPSLNSVPGRMQRVDGFNIFIDFSHTPDALKKALTVLKHGISKSGRIIVVFGCGGDRDKGKRSLMGQIADEFSDIAIITDDNPRTEDPSVIREEIKKHCKKGINIGSREKAIEYAIKEIKDGDVLVIAGKGHETYQILADRTIDFNDYKIAQYYACQHLV